MTPIEQILQNLVQISIWSVVKIFVLIALFLYIIFAFLVVREVDLMDKTVKDIFNLPLRIISLLHLLFAILVFILGLIVL